MARYKVVERRCFDATYIVEAESAEAAGRLDGDIVSEDPTDSDNNWGLELLSVEEVDEGYEL